MTMRRKIWLSEIYMNCEFFLESQSRYRVFGFFRSHFFSFSLPFLPVFDSLSAFAQENVY